MNFKIAMIWLAGALFLVILAQYLPKVAVWLTGLMLVSVLLINSNKYVSFFQGLTTTVTGK